MGTIRLDRFTFVWEFFFFFFFTGALQRLHKGPCIF